MSEGSSENLLENTSIKDFILYTAEWLDTEIGKSHKQFVLGMVATLQHSHGEVPIVEKRKNGNLLVVWSGKDKHYGFMLMPDGVIANVCKEQDGRVFATTKIQ